LEPAIEKPQGEGFVAGGRFRLPAYCLLVDARRRAPTTLTIFPVLSGRLTKQLLFTGHE